MRCFWLIMAHKWYVLLAGLKFGVPLWRLITHDWTKLLPCEFPHYQRQFFGDRGDPAGFVRCWTHHQNSNDHHWEYWVPRTGHTHTTPPYPDNEPIPMSEEAIREMVADWYGASRAYEGHWPSGGSWPWFDKHFARIRLHPETRASVLAILSARRDREHPI
jgi:hypothetical protein